MSFEEIKNKNPSKSTSLKVIKRTQFDIKMNGGNDFKLESENKEIRLLSKLSVIDRHRNTIQNTFKLIIYRQT